MLSFLPIYWIKGQPSYQVRGLLSRRFATDAISEMNGTSARVAKTPNQSLFPLDVHTFSGDKPLTTVDDQSTINCLFLSFFLTLCFWVYFVVLTALVLLVRKFCTSISQTCQYQVDIWGHFCSRLRDYFSVCFATLRMIYDFCSELITNGPKCNFLREEELLPLDVV